MFMCFNHVDVISIFSSSKLPIMHCCLSSKYGLLPGNFVELSRLNKNSICFLSMTSKLVFQQPRIHLKILTSSREFTDISVSKFVRNTVWNVLCAVKF